MLDQLQIIIIQNKQCTEDVEVKHRSFWLISQINFPNPVKDYGDLYKPEKWKRY